MMNDKENTHPVHSATKMTSELFSALFEVQRERNRSPELKKVAEVVDMTTQGVEVVDGLAERQRKHKPSVPSSSGPSSCSSSPHFCSNCLMSLTKLNFLAKLQHTKTCGGNAKMVDGRRALGRFLAYYGYEDFETVFASKGIDLNILKTMDLGLIEQETGVKGLGGRTKFVLGLEQFKERGRLHVRSSLISDQRGGVNGGEKKKKHRKTTWARSTPSMVRIKREHEGPVQPCRVARTSVSPLGKVILESLWYHPTHDGKRSIKSTNSTNCSSLWMAAGTCLSRHIGLEERLQRNQKATASPHKQRLQPQAGQPQPQSVVDSLATKRIRLKAMQDELVVQQQTICELQAMIRELQQEIAADSCRLGKDEGAPKGSSIR
jgi:hypothetical protein